MRTIKYKNTTFHHGQKVTARQFGKKERILGKLYIDQGHIYFCQNSMNGDWAPDNLGFKYSWRMTMYADNKSFRSHDLLDFEAVKPTIQNYEIF